jgi:hypothetical protein
MAPTTPAARAYEHDALAAILAFAVTDREPDPDIADRELAWWLARQERAEVRAELAAAGLL